MLSEHERGSLKLIFERISPEKLGGTLDTLLSIYRENNPGDVASIAILEQTLRDLERLKKKTLRNDLYGVFNQ